MLTWSKPLPSLWALQGTALHLCKDVTLGETPRCDQRVQWDMLHSGDFDCVGAFFSCRNFSRRLSRIHLVSSSGQMLQSVIKKAQQLTAVRVMEFLPAAGDSAGITLPICWGMSWVGWGTGGPPAHPDSVTRASPSLPSTRRGRLQLPVSPGGSRCCRPPLCDAGAERVPGTISTVKRAGVTRFGSLPGMLNMKANIDPSELQPPGEYDFEKNFNHRAARKWTEENWWEERRLLTWCIPDPG